MQQKITKISLSIPEDVAFDDLNLARDPQTGDILFDWHVIEKICDHNQIDITFFKDQHEDYVGGLLAHWYIAHRASGGKINPAAESLMAEIEAEDQFGAINVLKSSAHLQ